MRGGGGGGGGAGVLTKRLSRYAVECVLCRYE